MTEENDVEGGADPIIGEERVKAFREAFEPDMKQVVRALAVFAWLHMKLKALGGVTKEEDRGIMDALGVVTGHLSYAYPGFNEALES
jgi:hypothetical protein